MKRSRVDDASDAGYKNGTTEVRPVLRRRSSTRCDPKRDARSGGGDLFCVDFARGRCTDPECTHRHAIPVYPRDDADPGVLNATYDIFGRKRSLLLTAWEKAHGQKEDGANDLSLAALKIYNLKPPKPQRTELCGGSRKKKDLDYLIRREFGKFGDVAEVRIDSTLTTATAIVVFRGRAQAEFAKEAMTGQGLTPDSKETLQLKWASSVTSILDNVGPHGQDAQLSYVPNYRPAAVQIYGSSSKASSSAKESPWRRYFDAGTGRPYFVHSVSGATSWTLPSEETTRHH